MLPNSFFSDEQLQTICENANVIACECPTHLVDLLRKVREFRYYTTDCIELSPSEAETHSWLSERVLQIESLLSHTIAEFIQREDLLDEQHQLDLGKLAERNRQAALRQWQTFTSK